MKKLLLMAALIAAACSLQARERIQLVFDYQDGIYQGYTYATIQQMEEDFLKDQLRYEGRFRDGLANEFTGLIYTPDEINPEEPILLVKILQVDRKGTVLAEVSFKEKTVDFKGKGGVFGSWLNLFGDGMKSLGENIGIWLRQVAK